MKLFTLFYFASGQIQGPPGSIPAGRRGVENFDFQDAFGPPGELNLGRKEKIFSQQDIEVIYVSHKIIDPWDLSVKKQIELKIKKNLGRDSYA